MTLLIEILGWTGMALIASAYFLVSHDKVRPGGRTYQAMNILGSLGIAVDVFSDRSWPALALQIVWIMIGLSALLGSAKKERS